MSSAFAGQAGTTGTWPNVPFGGKIEDKEWLERVDHPLLNDVVLKLLFQYVRRDDLIACRGVCKKWNVHTIPHIRSKFQVTIHGNYEEERAEAHRIQDFVTVFESNELGIPFAKYRLGPFDTTDGAGKQFLEICGESIKEIVLFQPRTVDYLRTIESISAILTFSSKLEALALYGIFVSQSRNVVKLFPDSTPVLSSLRTLTLSKYLTNSNSCEFPIDYCPTFFEELLGVAGNVSDITVHDFCKVMPENCVVSSVLNSIEKLGLESSIQSLSLDPLRLEHVETLEILAEKPNGLKLKKLGLPSNFSSKGIGYAAVQIKLATIFKDTLEDFNVDGGLLGNQLMEFPKMPKLKSYISSISKSHQLVNLNQIFPVIETLDLGFLIPDIDSDPLDPYSEFQVCPTVKSLSLYCKPRGIIHPFLNIMRIFPNLTTLSLNITGEGARKVVRRISGMTQLESLSLDGNIGSRHDVDLDYLVTGIPIQGLNTIYHAIPYLERMTVEKRREKISYMVEKYKTKERSIRNLKNLRHLKLSMWAWWGNLTDVTGYLVFYLMKSLNHLHIRNCEFTKTCCEILTRETGLEAWSFTTGHFGGIVSDHIIPPF